MMNNAANGHIYANYPTVFDYAAAPPSHLDAFPNALDKVSLVEGHRWFGWKAYATIDIYTYFHFSFLFYRYV